MIDFSGKSFVIVDDTENNLMLFSALAEARGAEVHACNSGEACIELLKNMHPDLILLDIQMPGMDGYATLAHIKSMDKLVETPVIALTAHAMSGDRESIMEQGFSGYIAKPVDTRSFPEQVNAILLGHS